MLNSLSRRLILVLDSVGELSLFGLRAVRATFHPPIEFGETTRQIVQIGWRSGPLVMISGFAFGIVLALQTGSSMARFGAEAMIPQAISLGLFRDVGPLITGLLISGRVGAGIGAELAGMRVTEQIDALEALAVDSFRYLVVTRIIACVIALPILTLLLNYSGVLGGLVSELVAYHISVHLFMGAAFGPMSWSDPAYPENSGFRLHHRNGLLLSRLYCDRRRRRCWARFHSQRRLLFGPDDFV